MYMQRTREQAMDLVAASREHLAFLRDVHLCKRDLYSSESDLKQAVSVYLRCWLPTLKSSFDTGSHPLLPHLDVAWVWHLHKIDPTSYQRDCCRWYGRVLDVPLGMSPFWHSSELSSAHESATDKDLFVEEEFLERISASARSQSKFLWHVRWPEYDNTEFLEESVTRYEMMLRLMKENPTQFIVPTYDIDNIWHTHLAFPCRYVEDCCRLVGRPVHHDDDVGHDRSSTSFLKASSINTERLWQSSFGTAWRKEGGMYRGEPPVWYWADRLRATAPVRSTAQAADQPALNFTSAITILGRAFGTAGDSEVRAPGTALLRHFFPAAHGRSTQHP